MEHKHIWEPKRYEFVRFLECTICGELRRVDRTYPAPYYIYPPIYPSVYPHWRGDGYPAYPSIPFHNYYVNPPYFYSVTISDHDTTTSDVFNQQEEK